MIIAFLVEFINYQNVSISLKERKILSMKMFSIIIRSLPIFCYVLGRFRRIVYAWEDLCISELGDVRSEHSEKRNAVFFSTWSYTSPVMWSNALFLFSSNSSFLVSYSFLFHSSILLEGHPTELLLSFLVIFSSCIHIYPFIAWKGERKRWMDFVKAVFVKGSDSVIWFILY
jgi:hypothetical protein